MHSLEERRLGRKIGEVSGNLLSDKAYSQKGTARRLAKWDLGMRTCVLVRGNRRENFTFPAL